MVIFNREGEVIRAMPERKKIYYRRCSLSFILLIMTIECYVYDQQKDESSLVKLAMPVIPMVDDYAWTDPLSMTK